jgi:hypothetical protein
MYRIKAPGVVGQQGCVDPRHTQFSWTNRHSALIGLGNDDHPQYLLANGTRALTGSLLAGGFKITGLAAGTGAGDAVRYEQAVKAGDGAGGDVAGSYPNLLTVRGLQSRAVSTTPPAEGEVLTFNATTATWEPRAAAGGVTGAGITNRVPKWVGATSLSSSIIYDNFEAVGIGTSTPRQKLDVLGFVRGALGLCIGDDCRTAWPTLGAGGAAGAIPFWAAANVLESATGLRWDPVNQRLGIGSFTPSSPLTVAGMMESTSGGFKFPDGTVQTTAATATVGALQHARLTGISVGAANGIASIVNWSTPFPDVNYTVSCSLGTEFATGMHLTIREKANSSVTVAITNERNDGATDLSVDCIAIHD